MLDTHTMMTQVQYIYYDKLAADTTFVTPWLTRCNKLTLTKQSWK